MPYCTSLYLTKGILEVPEPERTSHYGGVYVRTERGGQMWIASDNFCATREAAEERAKEMAQKRLESLRKQVAKLEKLAVTPKWARVKK